MSIRHLPSTLSLQIGPLLPTHLSPKFISSVFITFEFKIVMRICASLWGKPLLHGQPTRKVLLQWLVVASESLLLYILERVMMTLFSCRNVKHTILFKFKIQHIFKHITQKVNIFQIVHKISYSKLYMHVCVCLSL